MNARVPVIVCLGIAAILAEAAPPPGAVTVLKKAGYFSVWPTGVAPKTTANEISFRDFLSGHPRAEDALALVTEGTAAGKIYGLLALKKIAPAEFEKASAGFVKDGTLVSICTGCMEWKEPASSLVRKIATGEISP